MAQNRSVKPKVKKIIENFPFEMPTWRHWGACEPSEGLIWEIDFICFKIYLLIYCRIVYRAHLLQSLGQHGNTNEFSRFLADGYAQPFFESTSHEPTHRLIECICWMLSFFSLVTDSPGATIESESQLVRSDRSRLIRICRPSIRALQTRIRLWLFLLLLFQFSYSTIEYHRTPLIYH